MDSLGKREPLHAPDRGGDSARKMSPEELEERQALFQIACTNVFGLIKEERGNTTDPDKHNLLLRAFDYVKYGGHIDMRDAEVASSQLEMEKFVKRKIVEQLAATVTYPEQFENMDAVFPTLFDVVKNEFSEMMAGIRKRFNTD